MKPSLLSLRNSVFIVMLLSTGLQFSCKVLRFSFNINKHIPENKHLLDKVVIKDEPRDFEDPLYSLVRQKPNKRFLGIVRFQMWQYLIADKTEFIQSKNKKIAEQQAKLKIVKSDLAATDSNTSKRKIKKLQNKITKIEDKILEYQKDLDDFRSAVEGPVILDLNQHIASARDMKMYLADKGYMKANVEVALKQSNKKAKVIYTITPGRAYNFKNFNYKIYDPGIEKIVRNDSSEPLIYAGLQYDADVISEQRAKIVSLLKNHGYFDFQLQYVRFKLDTTGGEVATTMIILNPEGRNNHKIYKVGEVTVEPEYSFGDTTQKDRFKYDSFGFVRLYQLNNYEFVDIVSTPDSFPYTDTGTVDFYLRLSPKKKRALLSDFEVNRQEETDKAITNAYSTLYGISTSGIFRDNNLYHRALQFETRLRGAVEIPFDTIHLFRPVDSFINYQVGATASLIFPQLVSPIRIPEKWNWRQLTSSTSLNLNYIYENNSYYSRTTGNLNLSYQWQKKIIRTPYLKGKPIKFYLTPAEASLVNAKIFDTSKVSKDPLIRNLFDPHLITDSRFSYVINTQPYAMVKKPYWVFLNGAEAGGFAEQVFDLVSKSGIIDSTKGLGKKLYGLDYFNYVKLDADLRFYFPVLHNSNLVFRNVAGLGFPIFGSQTLPFEKRYYVGGANSVRAFRSREVGPGTYLQTDKRKIDKSGDVKLEGSMEFRFPIYGYFKGALFVDYGNVWLDKKDSLRPGAKLSKEFWKELAIGPGAGLRFDMSLFVFRADFAIPFHDPAYPEGSRWVYRNYTNDQWAKKVNFQLAIGYPF
ncbi:MAG: BamA/TamA family outer membrane protein [Bacteroidetes bacterium]|nr:BamA/TamA family outer membrane protein [Bacteroidota bacterium]